MFQLQIGGGVGNEALCVIINNEYIQYPILEYRNTFQEYSWNRNRIIILEWTKGKILLGQYKSWQSTVCISSMIWLEWYHCTDCSKVEIKMRSQCQSLGDSGKVRRRNVDDQCGSGSGSSSSGSHQLLFLV